LWLIYFFVGRKNLKRENVVKNVELSVVSVMKVLYSAAFVCSILPAFADPLTLTWSGGASGRFSDVTWSGGTQEHSTPQNGDTLVFGNGGTFENDLASLSVAGLSFTASEPVTLTGKSITVVNGGTGLQTAAGDVTFDLSLNLGSAAIPAMSITVAQGATNTFLKCVSGAADIVYDGLGRVNLRADSDYTGETTVKLGQIHAYADGSFGSSAGPTRYLPASKDSSANLVFHGITTDEPFDNRCLERSKALQFPEGTTNVFNGTYVERSADFYFYGARSRVVYMGKASFENPSSGNADATAVIEYRGAGTEFGYDWFNGGNHFYYAPCLMRGGGYGQRMRLGEGKAQLRALRCENALLYDPATPAIVGVRSGKGVLDLGGFDQTFWYIDCSSANAATCITSALPSTVHLTLGTSGKVVTNTCCATFKGPVSLSFEGSGIPVRLGTSSPATGSLSLSNGSDVTLLDGFGWKGTSLSVADGSVLKVGSVSLPKDTTLCIDDRAAASGAEAKSSRLILNGNMAVEYLKLNGKTVRGGWTYGSSESTADIKDDVHFSGKGVLRVRKPCGFYMTVR
jgi:hypothetical protein